MKIDPYTGPAFAFLLPRRGEFRHVPEKEIAQVQGVAAAGNHAVSRQHGIDAGFETVFARPGVEFLAFRKRHFQTEAVAEFDRSPHLGTPEAFQGDAAGIIRQMGNILAHVLADAAHKRRSIGGTGTGRGAGQKEESALRSRH